MSCSRGPGRLPRHGTLNDLVFRGLVRAGYPSTKEPAGLVRTDGRRPDGLTLILWRVGRCLVWNATVSDTLATSYLPDTSETAGAAAERASALKTEKYRDLSSTHHFIPLAFETLGPINIEGLTFLTDLGKKLSSVTGDPRETAFLFQRISLTIQRFNAVAFRAKNRDSCYRLRVDSFWFRGTFADQDQDD